MVSSHALPQREQHVKQFEWCRRGGYAYETTYAMEILGIARTAYV
jgi:hypothetical protein